MIKNSIFFLLTITASLNCMENMQDITKATDVAQFAGKVVAYTTSSFYLGSMKGVTLGDNIKCGYIDPIVSPWASGESGYNMSQLLHKHESPGNKALIDSILLNVQLSLNAQLKMRVVTPEEAHSIRTMVREGNACFEFEYDITSKNALKALEQ